MKKYGKYEKRPEGVPEKQPKVKSALLQTYFTSLICLVLCVSMFFGTSYAWFTSEVTNEGNEIYIGTLDVDLQDENGESLDGSDKKLFDGNIRWEPGYTALETIKVVNEGDLAFMYELTFVNNGTDSGILAEAAKNFVVYVHKGGYADDETAPKSFDEIEASAKEDGAWQQIMLGQEPATLADILEKKIPVLSGSMSDVRADIADPTVQTPGPNDSKATEHTYIIALHMNEDAEGESIMGQRIQLNVMLKAYQRTYEKDAFDATYDLENLKALVTELGQQEISYRLWTNHSQKIAEPMLLDAAYQFQPVESAEEAENASYKKYIADFVVWADKSVPAEAIALAGYYDAWCSMIDDDWIVLTSPDAIPANTEIRLVGSMGAGLDVTYEMLCEYGNDGIGFLCGLKDQGIQEETTVYVELRFYETELNEQGHYVIVDEENYIVAGKRSYTFPGTSTTP